MNAPLNREFSEIYSYWSKLRKFLQKDHKAFFFLKHVRPELFIQHQTGDDFEGIGGGNFVMGLAGLAFIEGISGSIVGLESSTETQRFHDEYLNIWLSLGKNSEKPEEKWPQQLPAGAKVFFSLNGLESFGLTNLSECLLCWKSLRNGLAHGFRPNGFVSATEPGLIPGFEDPAVFEEKYRSMRTLGPTFRKGVDGPKEGKWEVSSDALVKTLADDACSRLLQKLSECDTDPTGAERIKKVWKTTPKAISKL
jgi:hypothetical protein